MRNIDQPYNTTPVEVTELDRERNALRNIGELLIAMAETGLSNTNLDGVGRARKLFGQVLYTQIGSVVVTRAAESLGVSRQDVWDLIGGKVGRGDVDAPREGPSGLRVVRHEAQRARYLP